MKTEDIKKHQKELQGTLQNILNQLAQANKQVNELTVRHHALIGAIESCNLLLKKDEEAEAKDLPPVPADKEIPQVKEVK